MGVKVTMSTGTYEKMPDCFIPVFCNLYYFKNESVEGNLGKPCPTSL